MMKLNFVFLALLAAATALAVAALGAVIWGDSGDGLNDSGTPSAGGGNVEWPSVTVLKTNTFLHDNTNVPLHRRLQAVEGIVVDVDSAVSNAVEGVMGGIEKEIHATSNAIPPYAVSAGGYHYPDYFFATARAGGPASTETVLETNTTINVVEVRTASTSVRGWLLDSEIVRLADWSDYVKWTLDAETRELWDIEENTVIPDGATAASVSGRTYHVTGRLGDFERTVELPVTADNISVNMQWNWSAWADPSLALKFRDYSEVYADRYPALSAYLRTWPDGYGSGTNHVSAGWNTNFWDIPFRELQFGSCISYATDTAPGLAGGPYRPLTLVTPRHAIGANHFLPQKGSNVYWVGKSGAIHTNQVAAYKNLRGDLTVARLAGPVDTNDFAFPCLLPMDYEPYFYGCEHGGASCPGIPAVSFNFAEMAYMTYWQCAATLTGKRARDPKNFILRSRGSGTAHGRDAVAVGGDSGSPTFLLLDDTLEGEGENCYPILLGCFHVTTGGPIPLAEVVNAAIAEWGDEERAQTADFEAWGYPKHTGGMEPW